STDNSGSGTYSGNMGGQGLTVPGSQPTYTIHWLSPGRTYSLYVTARDKSRNTSGKSNTVTVTTPPDTTPPRPPTLSGVVRGPAQVSVAWTRTNDDLSPFVTWRIFANGVQVAEHVNWFGETSVVLRHLTRATSYSFTVRASDASGNTSTSNAVLLTTEA